MQKKPGADCPKCGNAWPAEYAQLNQPPKWSCQDCGACGDLAGELSIRSKAAAKAPAAAGSKRHWAAVPSGARG